MYGVRWRHDKPVRASDDRRDSGFRTRNTVTEDTRRSRQNCHVESVAYAAGRSQQQLSVPVDREGQLGVDL